MSSLLIRTAFLALFLSPSPAATASEQVLVRVFNGPVSGVFKVEADIWVASRSGAFLFGEEGRLKNILGGIPVTSIVGVRSDVVRIGTDVGLFEYQKEFGKIDCVKCGLKVTSLLKRGNSVLVGTFRNGLLECGHSGPCSTIIKDVRVNAIYSFKDEVWVATDGGAYRISKDGSPDPILAGPKISGIFKTEESLWLVRVAQFELPAGYIQLDANGTMRDEKNADVLWIVDANGEPLFGGLEGVYSLRQGSPERENWSGLDEAVNVLYAHGDEVWAGSTERVYFRKGGEVSAIPSQGRGINVKGIERIGEDLWAWGDRGAFRVAVTPELEADFSTVNILGFDVLFGTELRLNAVTSESSEGLTDQKEVDGEWEFENNEGEFVPREDFVAQIDHLGSIEVPLVAKDPIGNLISVRSDKLLVIPSWVVWPAAVVLFWVVILGLILVLAPYSDMVSSAVTSNVILKAGSLFTFRLIPHIPLMRRHMLVRYRKAVVRSDEFAGWLQRGGVPAADRDFETSLGSREDFCLLRGKPSSVAAVMRFLAWRYALPQRFFRLRGGRPTPIFINAIDLGIKDKADLIGSIAGRLNDLGSISDEAVAGSMLRRGGFLILLNCAESITGGAGADTEEEDDVLVPIRQFINESGDRNLIMIGVAHEKDMTGSDFAEINVRDS